MMNIRKVFLVVSVLLVGNVYCSDDQGLYQATSFNDVAIAASDPHGQLPSAAQDDSVKVVEPIAPSNLWTKAWYGAAKHVAGKTAYSILMELHDSGKLKADYEANPNEAMNRFNEAVAERFTRKDLLDPEKQQKIKTLFKSTFKINNEFVLAKALAKTYLQKQQEAMVEILQKQACVLEPLLQQQRDAAISRAHTEYGAALEKEFLHAKNGASNCRYLAQHADSKEVFDLQSKNHYKNSASYLALLVSIRAGNKKLNDK